MTKIAIVVEGDDDRETLKALQTAKLLNELKILDVDKSIADGSPTLARRAIAAADSYEVVITIRDLDGDDCSKAKDWFHKQMTLMSGISAHDNVWMLNAPGRKSKIAFLSVGKYRQTIAGFNIPKYALDDYLLDFLSKSEALFTNIRGFEVKDKNLVFHKLEKIFALLTSQKIEIHNSKRLLFLLRSICGFRASPATFARTVILAGANHDSKTLVECYEPVCEQIAAATALLMKD